MRVRTQIVVLAALLSTPLYGVRITGGFTTRSDDLHNPVFTVNGPNFALEIDFLRVFSYLGPFESECHLFAACGPGDLMDLVGFGVQSSILGGSGTINGIFYPGLNLGNAATNYGTGFFSPDPPFSRTITLTDSLRYVSPIEVTGGIAAYLPDDPSTCVLCGRSDETFDGLDSLPIVGRGQVIVTLVESDREPEPGDPEQLFRLESVTYRFEVPEPATFVITGTALAVGLLLVSRRSRVPANH